MGAYTNPQEVLDTQTGQYFQNLQSTISQSVAGVATAYKTESERKRKELEENKTKLNNIILGVQKNTSKMYDDIGKVSQAKQNVNFSEALNPFVKEFSDISLRLDTGASIDPQKDVQKQAEFRNAIGYIQGDIENFSADTNGLYPQIQNAGRMGGISADPDINKIELVEGYVGLMGKLPNETRLITNIEKPTERTWMVKVNGKDIPFDGATIQNIHNNNGKVFTIIPDTTDRMLKLIQDNNIYNMEAKQNSKGESTLIPKDISEKYLGPEERVLSKSTKPGEKVFELKRKVDIAAIKVAITNDAKVQVSGILDDTRESAAWYNEEYQRGKKDFKKKSPDYFATDEGKDEFTRAYIEYATRSIGEYQSVMNTAGDVATSTIDTKSTKSKTTSTTTDGSTTIAKAQFTPKEIETKLKDFDKIIERKIDKVTIEIKGPRGGKGNERTFMYNKSTGRVEEWDGKDLVNERVSRKDFLDIMKNQ